MPPVVPLCPALVWSGKRYCGVEDSETSQESLRGVGRTRFKASEGAEVEPGFFPVSVQPPRCFGPLLVARVSCGR